MLHCCRWSQQNKSYQRRSRYLFFRLGRQIVYTQKNDGVAFLMNWDKILANAGIDEPPGRKEAYKEAATASAKRYAANGRKQAHGKGAAKPKVKEI